MLAGGTWLVAMCLMNHELWKIVYHVIPGASAIRSMGRIGVAALLPLGICVSGCVSAGMSHLTDKYGWKIIWANVLSGILFVTLVIDGGATFQYGFSKRENAVRLGTVTEFIKLRDCKVFHFSSTDTPWKTEIDAMWASIMTGVPTINGYSGNIPPGYATIGINAGTRQDLATLERWLAKHGSSRPSNEICALP
jgi:hypothetical protein